MEEEKILEHIKTIVLDTGKILKSRQSAPLKLTSKGFRDLVTDADYAAQAYLTQEIQNGFPTHGFITEEEDSSLPESGDVIWVIDPIDGTTNFSRGMPTFSISIAAGYPTEEGLDLFLGIVYDPQHGEMFYALRGHGAFCNGKPIAPTPATEPIDGILAVDWSRDRENRTLILKLITELAHDVKTLRSIGTAALALAYVAAGRLDAYCHVSLSLWDMAAGVVLLREVNGGVSNLMGESWSTEQTSILTTNGPLHPFFVNRIQQIIA